MSAESRNTRDLDTLANNLSKVLRNPLLPEKFGQDLLEMVMDLSNNGDRSETLDYEKSPEYIGRVLRGLQRKSEAKND